MSEPTDIDVPVADTLKSIIFSRHDLGLNVIHTVQFIYKNGVINFITFEDAPGGARAVYDHFIDAGFTHDYDETLRVHILSNPNQNEA